MPAINWDDLQALADRLTQPGRNQADISDADLLMLDQALEQLRTAQDWPDIIRLRRMFNALLARDTFTGLLVMQRLSSAAITAAEQLGDKQELAHLLGAEGHNLHRQGYHRKAIEAFERSAQLFQETGDPYQSLKNYFMTSLCHRALGDRQRARQILDDVLQRTSPDDPWRGEPLQVMSWLTQDEGRLADAERLLREAIEHQRRGKDSDILVAGALTDLAEMVGLQGRVEEAKDLFQQSLSFLSRHEGQYNRQEARTRLKLADLLMQQKEYEQALQLLNEAEDRISVYGLYYDLVWRIEMTRAFIFFRLGHWTNALRKARSALHIRRRLGLSIRMLLRQLVSRLHAGTGLPR